MTSRQKIKQSKKFYEQMLNIIKQELRVFKSNIYTVRYKTKGFGKEVYGLFFKVKEIPYIKIGLSKNNEGDITIYFDHYAYVSKFNECGCKFTYNNINEFINFIHSNKYLNSLEFAAKYYETENVLYDIYNENIDRFKMDNMLGIEWLYNKLTNKEQEHVKEKAYDLACDRLFTNNGIKYDERYKSHRNIHNLISNMPKGVVDFIYNFNNWSYHKIGNVYINYDFNIGNIQIYEELILLLKQSNFNVSTNSSFAINKINEIYKNSFIKRNKIYLKHKYRKYNIVVSNGEILLIMEINYSFI